MPLQAIMKVSLSKFSENNFSDEANFQRKSCYFTFQTDNKPAEYIMHISDHDKKSGVVQI